MASCLPPSSKCSTTSPVTPTPRPRASTPASTTTASCSSKASASTAVGRMRAVPAAVLRPSRTSTRHRPTACPRPSARSSPRWTSACSPSGSFSSTRGYRARLPAASTSFSTPICRGIASAMRPSEIRCPFTTKWWPRYARVPTPISDGWPTATGSCAASSTPKPPTTPCNTFLGIRRSPI